MKLTFETLTELPGLVMRRVGGWYHITEGKESRWVYEDEYRVNRERLTKVDRSKPTAHRDEVRQWRAMRKGGIV